jgi:putative transcriptional regulator
LQAGDNADARLNAETKAAYDRLTPGEIERMAADDPANFEATAEETANGFRAGDLRRLRERLGLSQSEFAGRYRINLRTLQDWEQMRRLPDQIARTYLQLILFAPEIVAELEARRLHEAMLRHEQVDAW